MLYKTIVLPNGNDCILYVETEEGLSYIEYALSRMETEIKDWDEEEGTGAVVISALVCLFALCVLTLFVVG